MAKFKTKHEVISRDDLETIKLISEIRSLKLFWLIPALNLAVAILAALIGFWSGFFDTNMKLIEIERNKLENLQDSIEDKQILLKKLNLITIKKDSLEIKLTDSYNQIDSKNKMIHNKDSIIEVLNKWITTNQPRLDLKQEVLSFVKEIRVLIDEFNKINSYSNFPVLCNIYNFNYQQKAILYRTKLEYYIYGLNSVEDFEGFRNYTTIPASIISMRYVADDLENLANKLTN
jgi:hypothetical protein